MAAEVHQSYVKTYSFDDLLVNCAKEVITNGFETENMEPTIKDWLCGKIVRALPSELIKKILMFILESKEINEHLSFRQSKSPTHDELVLLLYKNQSNKRKADEELRLSDIKKSKNFMSDSTADMHTAASLPPAILQSLNEAGLNLPENLTPAQNQEQDNTYTIFNQQTHEIKQFTQNFFADEMIVHNEPKGLVYTNASALNLPTLGSNLTGIDDRFTQRKPRQRAEIDDVSSLLSNFKKKLKSNTNPAKKTKFLRDSSLNGHDSSYEPGKSDPEDDEDHNSYQTEDSDSDYESAAKKAKNPRAKNKGAGGKPSKYVAIDYETHDHLEAVNFRVPDSTTRFKCAICDVDVVYHGKYGLNAHIKKIHPNFWEKYKHKFVEVRRSMAEEAEAMEEIIIDPITKKYTCKLCGKDWDRPNGCVLHVNRVHLKKTEGVCKYCNKEFSSLANLRMHEMTHTDTYSHYCEYCGKGVRKLKKLREHKKVHHPELYAIECKEEAEKKRQKELDSERKLENGEIIAGQRINLDEFDIADIVDRVIYDSNKYYDPDEMFSV